MLRCNPSPTRAISHGWRELTMVWGGLSTALGGLTVVIPRQHSVQAWFALPSSKAKYVAIVMVEHE